MKADRGLIVLSVLQRLSGSGQEETNESHENEGIVLPAHRQCQRAFTDAGRERAESESDPPPVTEKPAEV